MPVEEKKTQCEGCTKPTGEACTPEECAEAGCTAEDITEVAE